MALISSNLGVHDISGSTLTALIDQLSPLNGTLSGGGLYFIPVANGNQVWCIKIDEGG